MVIYLITGYEVRKEGYEEVLILHLSYDVEFSLDFYKRKSGKSMKQLISDYIKRKGIVWNGNKILLFFGGIALGTLLFFGQPFDKEEPRYVYVNDSGLSSVSVNFSQSDLGQVSSEKEESSSNISSGFDESIEKKEQGNEKEESKSPDTPTVGFQGGNLTQIDTSKNNLTKEELKEQNGQSTVNSSTNHDVQIKDETTTHTEKPTEKQITIYRKNGSVVSLSMTDYLIGVVAAEMPASFPLEALKAQSIVARTYALKKLASGGKLTDDVSTQVYRDEAYLRSMWKNQYDTYYNKIKTAVLSTKDLTLRYNGSYIEAIYHSTSNGRTEDAVHVWGNSVPYLKSVESPWDQSAPSYLRTVEQDVTSLFATLGIDFSDPVSLEILSRNESGRISRVRLGDTIYSGVQFRNLLGLRSADFDLEIESGKLKITTRGYGHGVGMSQYGAKGMAESGYSYTQILAHYYPRTMLGQ